jgi:uncharacterized protein YlxW (UPF0749 family)
VTVGEQRAPGARDAGERPRPVPHGLRGLLGALAPRRTRGQAAVAALCALLGFGLAVQVTGRGEAGLATAREEDLVRILDDLAAREQRLAAELDRLREARGRLADPDTDLAAARAEAERRAWVLGVLAGTLPADGPGVVLTVEDPAGTVPAEVLLDAVEELRNAGAEALQIGDVRVVASTYLVDAEGGVEVDGRVLRPPYVFRAAGDPETLEPALRIRGGVVDTVARHEGALATVDPREQVEVSAVREPDPLEHAEPVLEE